MGLSWFEKIDLKKPRKLINSIILKFGEMGNPEILWRSQDGEKFTLCVIRSVFSA